MTNWKKANRNEGNMTCLQGTINTTYARLVELFGPPHITGGDKVNSEWVININGDVATIYDYKEPITPTDDYDWHIGGHKRSVVDKIISIVKGGING